MIEVHKWIALQVEQLVDCSEMTGVDILMMVSVLLRAVELTR